MLHVINVLTHEVFLFLFHTEAIYVLMNYIYLLKNLTNLETKLVVSTNKEHRIVF